MNLIDVYVGAVRMFLPNDQRDDIIRELLDDLRSQTAEKETDLGRPLSEDEQAAVLRQYGHPILMAARYRPQRQLIGPVVFPYYWLGLKIAIGLTLVSHGVSLVTSVLGGVSFAELGVAFGALVRHALIVMGWFTLLAAILDRWLARSRILENWDPRELRSGLPAHLAVAEATRRVEKAGSLVRDALERARPPFRVTSIPQFVACVIVAVWWLLGLKFPVLILGTGAAILDWAPVVDRLFPFLVMFQTLVLVNQFVTLTRRPATRFHAVARVVWANAGWVLVVFLLMVDHQWVMWTGTPEQWSRFETVMRIAGHHWSIVDIVNGAISISLMLVAALYLADTVRLWHRARRHIVHA